MVNWQIKCVSNGDMIVASGTTSSASSCEIPENIGNNPMEYLLEFTGDSGCSGATTFFVKPCEEDVVCDISVTANPSSLTCAGGTVTFTITDNAT